MLFYVTDKKKYPTVPNERFQPNPQRILGGPELREVKCFQEKMLQLVESLQASNTFFMYDCVLLGINLIINTSNFFFQNWKFINVYIDDFNHPIKFNIKSNSHYNLHEKLIQIVKFIHYHCIFWIVCILLDFTFNTNC